MMGGSEPPSGSSLGGRRFGSCARDDRSPREGPDRRWRRAFDRVRQEEFVARRGQRLRRARRTAPRAAGPCPRPRQRRHHPGARPHRARGRGSRPARARAALGTHEVPGRRAAGARGACPGPGGRASSDAQRRRAAQAPRRDRDDPREDRRPRHLAARAPRRGRRRLRRRQVAHARHAAGRRDRVGPRRGRAPGAPAAATAAPPHRASGRAAVGRLATAGQPLPRPRLLVRPAERGPVAPPGQLGAARPALQLVRARRRREPRRAWRCPRRPPCRRRVACS